MTLALLMPLIPCGNQEALGVSGLSQRRLEVEYCHPNPKRQRGEVRPVLVARANAAGLEQRE